MPAVTDDHRDNRLVELVEAGDDVARGGALGERREPAHVEKQDRHVAFLAPQVGALCEDALGQRWIDESTERLAQLLTLAEPGDHRVERCGKFPGFVGADDGHAHGEIAGADPASGVAQVDDRPRDGIGEHEAEPHGDGRADDERDDARQRDRVEVAGVVGEQAGDDDACAPGDHRHHHQQAPVQGDPRDIGRRRLREALADGREHRSHRELERDVAQHRGGHVQQVGHGEQQRRLVGGELEQRGEHEARRPGSDSADRIQARTTHERQGQPRRSRPRLQRRVVAALAGEPGADRRRDAAQVDACHEALHDVPGGRAGGKQRQLSGAHIDEEHQRDDRESRHGDAVEDDGDRAGIEVAGAGAAVVGARQSLEESAATAPRCHPVRFSRGA